MGTILVLYLVLRPKWASPAVLVAFFTVCWDQLYDWLVALLPGSRQPPTVMATSTASGSQHNGCWATYYGGVRRGLHIGQRTAGTWGPGPQTWGWN